VARDRQRAKQRRQRQGGSVRAGARPAGRDAAAAARDADVAAPGAAGAPPSDPRDLEDVTGTGATPAPDPLKHASAEVDQARLAEAGAVHPDYDDEDLLLDEDEEATRAPDAVEGDLVPADATDPAVRERREERERGRLLTFLRHCVEELRRVQWPDRRQVGQATAVTLGFVVIAGAFLGLMDAIWQPLVNAIL